MLRRALFAGILVATIQASGLLASGISDSITAMEGTQARFVQKFTPRGFQKDQVESGTVVFGKSPRMRWNYAAPEPKVFVFDGTTSWFYVPSDKQVTIKTLTDAERKDLPFLLLGDKQAVSRNYTVRQSRKGGSIVSQLVSKDPSANIRTITVVSSTSDHRARSLSYTDRQGNRTVFQFSGFAPAQASASQFSFTPPPGTEIVRN